jgi:hypothetical protein
VVLRSRQLVLAFLAAAVAWSASAQSLVDQARDDYQAELVRQCPDKQLQMLGAAQLSDGLDDYKLGLPDDIRARFQKSETDECSSLDAGAACVNNADLETADEVGRISDVAGSICAAFLRCRSDGDCDYAR